MTATKTNVASGRLVHRKQTSSAAATLTKAGKRQQKPIDTSAPCAPGPSDHATAGHPAYVTNTPSLPAVAEPPSQSRRTTRRKPSTDAACDQHQPDGGRGSDPHGIASMPPSDESTGGRVHPGNSEHGRHDTPPLNQHAESRHELNLLQNVNAASADPNRAAMIANITLLVKHRHASIEARKALVLRLGARLRSTLGWTIGGDAKANKAAKDKADYVVACANKGEVPNAFEDGTPLSWVQMEFAQNVVESVVPFTRTIRRCDKELIAAMAATPLAAWVDGFRGLGAVSIASLIAELGAGHYSTPGKMAARMAVFRPIVDGKIDRNPGNGYSARRRTVMYLITSNLIRSKNEWARGIYDARQAFTTANRPEWTPGRRLFDAHRIIAQQFLRLFWVEWANAKEWRHA